MKVNLLFIVLLFFSCTNSHNFNGHVYDYDTEKPIQDVDINGNKTKTDSTGYFCLGINSNLACKIILKKEDYVTKKIYRKPDSLGKFSQKSLKYNRLYLFTKESDFTHN
ncbi:hypothetical protein C8C83_5644 [Flavobacterium sp. 90]|uniref:hypothetical protein n=1 Tax=unclassified Flavobacterium TaxID=196869 RepID=UPI000EB1F6A7|nr:MULTISPECIES: hypothetical protein [unclassified Flavobacterium]RKR08405.1 hypothetical protein C8C82_0275 [Flavobacterium sp. 81]TCK57593.1 hypothetical protein C8C83_5644 [Flavobacterium sp. 90]